MQTTNKIHLFNTNRDKDYQFIDNNIKWQLEVGAPIFNVYKLLGTKDKDGNFQELDVIQDPVLMENVNRVYSDETFDIYGQCQIGQAEFTMALLGLSPLSPEIVQITFHYNTMIERLGRKFIPGDILEATFLRDTDLIDQNHDNLTRFFVVESSQRSKEGWDPRWGFHLWTINLVALSDSPEYQDIINKITKKEENSDDDDINSPSGNPSVYDKEISIMDAILEEAESVVKYTERDEHNLWVDLDNNGNLVAIDGTFKALSGHDGIPPNYNPEEVRFGKFFPADSKEGDYFLRTDYDPPRLFRCKKSGVWQVIEYQNRELWKGIPKYLEQFINNDKDFINDEGKKEQSRQILRETIKAKVSYKLPQEVGIKIKK